MRAFALTPLFACVQKETRFNHGSEKQSGLPKKLNFGLKSKNMTFPWPAFFSKGGWFSQTKEPAFLVSAVEQGDMCLC